MRTLLVGFDTDVEGQDIDHTRFRSRKSFLDYDLLIWDPSTLVHDYMSYESYQGLERLTDDDSARVVGDLDRRRREMKEMLELGRSVVVITPPPQRCYVATGEKQYSGTGRNRVTTHMVTELNLMAALPLKNYETVQAVGSNIEFRGGEPFSAFWRANKANLGYQAYFSKPVGTPLFLIEGTQRVVGSHLLIRDNGHLLFLPSLKIEQLYENPDLTEEEVENAVEEFIESIVALVTELRRRTGEFELPPWSGKYNLPDENTARSELKDLNEELNDILAKVSQQKQVIAELEAYKILFTGTGKALEAQVRRVFEELGFTVQEERPGRDDLILEYEDLVAVVEVKGVSKSAAEKHAAQLEKWVSEYYSSHGTNPKGILVVDTFNDTPLIERTKKSFPDQMLPYSQNRGHCLITGLQLLGMYLDCKDKPEKRAEMIKKIFDTVGEFDEYRDWSSFLVSMEDSAQP